MTRSLSPAPLADPVWTRVLRSLDAALEKKAMAPVVLDLREASQIADYFVLLSGRSDTQVRAIAEAIEERGRREGDAPLSVEGVRHGQWALLDYGDFVVHVFYEPVRRFYDLERLWVRAHRCELPVELVRPSSTAKAVETRPRE